MLVNIDVKGLEWVTIVWFAQDEVGKHEILTGVDQHAENQTTFGLPERRIAKIFVFRLIYGGTAWAYVFDPDFNWISKDPKYWQKVIDKFYDKYNGIKKQHDNWVREAIATGRLIMPTGRMYEFTPQIVKGELKWPRTQILNYPVQGTGHDIVTIARVSLWKRIKAHEALSPRVLFVSTVHDSIVLDVNFTTQDRELVSELVRVVTGVFSDVPTNFSRLFGVELNLPIQGEITAGSNLLDTEPLVVV